MPQFHFRQEAKITTLETTEFSIAAATQEEANQIARLMTHYDIAERDGVTLGKTWTDDNANRLIPVDQNDGMPTIHVFNDDTDELLISNAPDHTADNPLKKKELWAFVWNCSHLSRDASDEEVLKAWENSPSLSSDEEDDDTLYEVEKLTPDELAERINDDECPLGQDYVRFISV